MERDNKKSLRGKMFGLDVPINEADFILLPVPWEATVSPPSGTVNSPEYILKSSYKIELFNEAYPENLKVAMAPIPSEWAMLSDQLQGIANGYINSLEAGTNKRVYSANNKIIKKINQYCYDLKEFIRKDALSLLSQGKIVAVVGGDHSSCLGLIEALTTRHKDFGILQIDAQADLMPSQHGFDYSHNSVMHHVMNIPQVTNIVQVGLRDYSSEESKIINNSKGRISSFKDKDIKIDMYNGKLWSEICKNIADNLPERVYITFDIDGLDPKLCPGTAFPVPGGMDYFEFLYLIETIVKTGKEIIGFDICEVATGEQIGWDISVANKIILNLIFNTIKSQPSSKVKIDIS